MWYIVPHTKTKIIAHVHQAHGTRAHADGFFFGMNQLETRFVRNIFCLPLGLLYVRVPCRPSVGPSTGHTIIELIVPANSNLVPWGLGLRPERMLVFISFFFISFLFFSFLFLFCFPFVGRVLTLFHL